LAIGINRLLDDAIVIIADAIISVVLIEIESRRANDALSAEVLQPEIEILSNIGVRLIDGLLLVIKARLVDGCPPPDPTETAFGDAPGSAKHLYSPAQGLS